MLIITYVTFQYKYLFDIQIFIMYKQIKTDVYSILFLKCDYNGPDRIFGFDTSNFEQERAVAE